MHHSRSKPSQRRGSTQQLLAFSIIAAAVILGGTLIYTMRERAVARDAAGWAKQRFGLNSPVSNRLADAFHDANGDSVADAPEDESKWLRPEKLTFSYVAAEDVEAMTKSWQSVMDAIAEATDLPVEYHDVTNVEAQLTSLKDGTLHVTALNTGSVPRAVDAYGFVPVCTIADAEGTTGLRTMIIVPGDSEIKKVDELRGKKVTFTSERSNSGFKAPLVALSDEFGMSPDIDYQYSFANSHDEAIRLIAANEAVAAAVASDLLERAVKKGDIAEEQYRIIYQSEKFPAAALGHAHNLAPDLAAKIRDALIGFESAGTSLAELYASIPGAKLVPVMYKDDWALIRRIDNALGVKHN